jgi:hypothetical protein
VNPLFSLYMKDRISSAPAFFTVETVTDKKTVPFAWKPVASCQRWKPIQVGDRPDNQTISTPSVIATFIHRIAIIIPSHFPVIRNESSLTGSGIAPQGVRYTGSGSKGFYRKIRLN